MRWSQSIGFLLLIGAVGVAVGDGAECDCRNIRAEKYPGREVCGEDGMKYGSMCLAWCQGIGVAENEACGPGFALAVGGQPREILDWGVIMRFADKGMKYLGEEADELAGGQGHAPQEGAEHAVIVDLLLNEDGAVYGRPLTQSSTEAWRGFNLPKPRPGPGVHSRRLSFIEQFIRYETIFKDNLKDDRSPVPDTNSDPWRRIGVVEPASCTGVFIAENKVLTAAHCIVSSTTKSVRQKIRFAPAKNDDRRPYGTLSSRYSRVLSCYTGDGIANCDIGVITLSSYSVGSTVGWFGIASECTGQPVGLTIAGYPGEKDLRTMWFEVCGETQIICENSPRILQHTCDVSGGMSGAPLWDEQWNIRGVHSGWSYKDGIAATQITPEVQGVIQAWIDE